MHKNTTFRVSLFIVTFSIFLSCSVSPTFSFAKTDFQVPSNVEIKQRVFLKQELDTSIKERIFEKLNKANINPDFDAPTKASLNLLKSNRKSRDEKSVSLQKKIDSNREALKGEKDSKKKSKIESDISNSEAQFVSLAKEAKNDFSKLKQINDSLKKDRDTKVAAVLTPEEQKYVEVSDPNYLYQLDASYVPNDADLSTAWYLRSILTQQPDIFSGVSTQARPIVVAVIDSGVDYTHPELQGKMWSSQRCIDETGAVKSTSCVNGYDFIQNDSDPVPTDGAIHGTAVAGLLGAATDNGSGIASLSQNRVEIMALRVFDGGYATLDGLVKAVYFAVNNGAQVINMSLSGPSFSQALSDAISYAKNRGVVVVTTAGNMGTNIDMYPVYPAAYALDNIITVAASDKSGKLASFSSYGPATVDVAAPGVSIYTTVPGNTYTSLNGTSFSAPIVASYIARGLSEGKSASDSLVQVPVSLVVSGVKNKKVLGAPVQGSDGTDVNPFMVLDDGSMLNLYAKGGAPVGGEYGLDYQTINFRGDATIGFATQVSLGSTNLFSAPTISGNSTYLQWDTVSGAGSYGVYLTNHDTNTSVIYQDVRSTSQGVSVPTGTLPPGTYRWNTAVRRTTTANTKENLTAVYFFKVAGVTPAPTNYPSTITPGTSSPGPAVSGTSQVIAWSSVTNATSYKIALRDLSTGRFVLDDQSVTGTSYTASGLVASHYYKFDMLACNTTGCSPRSSDHYFYVPAVVSVPLAPTGISPSTATAPGLQVLGPGPASQNITWSSVSGATNYIIAWYEVTATGASVNGPVVNQNVGLATQFTVSGLSAGKYYTFNITACNAISCSTSSNYYFYIQAAPITPAYDLVPASFSLSVLDAVPGNTFSGSFAVKNAGTQSVNTPFKVTYYLAPLGAGLSEGAQVGESTINSLAANQATTISPSFTLPALGSSVYSGSGTYTIWAKVDSTNVVAEGNEANNRIDTIGVGNVRLNITNVNVLGQPQITIGAIGTQSAGAAFPLSVSTSNIPLGTRLYVNALVGDVSPSSFTLYSASLTKNITLGQTAAGQKITVSTAGQSGVSNTFAVTGTNPSNQKILTVRIKDAGGQPIKDAHVVIGCVGGVCIPQESITDVSGTTVINTSLFTTPINRLSVTVNALGKTKKYDDFTISSLATFKEYIFPATSPGTVLTPVVLIPGIMGSTAGSALTLPYLPGGAVQAEDLSIADTGGLLGWGSLRNDLVSIGYEEGKTVIDCPYDWRLPLDKTANTFFKDCVNKALASYPVDYVGEKKVDVVAHSMGGLVVRAYVQSSLANAQKIRKLAFLGTPQNGSTDAYLTWEGGETGGFIRKLILAKTLSEAGLDISLNKNVGSLSFLDCSADILSAHPFSSESDRMSFDASSYQSTQSTKTKLTIYCPSSPPRTVDLDYGFLGTTYSGGIAPWVVANNKFTREFVQANVPALKQLLPTYAFLIKKGEISSSTISDGGNQNEIINALNGKSCMDGVCNEYSYNNSPYSFSNFANTVSSAGISVKHYYRTDIDSTKQEIIFSNKGVNGLYEDGIPIPEQTLSSGDGTVPYEKSIKPFLDQNSWIDREVTNTSHEKLVGGARKSLVQFLSGVTLNNIDLNAATPVAGLSFSGQVRVRVTDPLGRIIGIDPTTGNGVNTILGANASVENGNNRFTIPNPSNGTYTVEVNGPYSTDYSFYVDYGSDSRSEQHEFTGYHSANVTETHTFQLNSSAVSGIPLYIFASDGVPATIKASKSGAVTKLDWSLPKKGTPTAYRIYAKGNSETSLLYVGQTSGLSYTTTYPFAAASSTLATQFFVSSVSASGAESFLSLAVQNDDTDGDGINDSTEITIGTNVNLTDTDGDGLTDGQEYYVYNTNPLIIDSDGDGVNDYTEVVNAISAAIASSSNPINVTYVDTPQDKFVLSALGDTYNIGTSNGEQGQVWIASSTYSMNKLNVSLTKGLGFVSGQTATLRINRGVGSNRTVLLTQSVPLPDSLPAYSAIAQPTYTINLATSTPITVGDTFSWTLQMNGGSASDQIRLGVQFTSAPTGWPAIVAGVSNESLKRPFTTLSLSTTTSPITAPISTSRDSGTFTTLFDSFNFGSSHPEQGQSWVANTTYSLTDIGIAMARGGGFTSGGNATFTLYRGYGASKQIASTQTFSTDIIPVTGGLSDQREVRLTLPTPVTVTAGALYSWTLKINSGHISDQIRFGIGSTATKDEWFIINGTSLLSTYIRKFTSYGVDVESGPVNQPPVVTRNGTNPLIIGIGEAFTDPGASAVDPEEGSLPVSVTGTVDFSTAGTYIRTYTATDSKGQSASKTRTIKVVLPPLQNKVETLPIPQINDSWNMGTNHGDQGQAWVAGTAYDLYKIGINVTRGLSFVPGSQALLTISKGVGVGKTILATTTINTDTIPSSGSISIQPEYTVTLPQPIPISKNTVYSWTLTPLDGSTVDQLRLGVATTGFIQTINWNLVAGSNFYMNLRRGFNAYGKENPENLDVYNIDPFELNSATSTEFMLNEVLSTSTEPVASTTSPNN